MSPMDIGPIDLIFASRGALTVVLNVPMIFPHNSENTRYKITISNGTRTANAMLLAC